MQGYSRSGVQTSQAMADSVVRYLVTEHQVPVYRIYKTGLGKNTAKPQMESSASNQWRSRDPAAQQPGDDGYYGVERTLLQRPPTTGVSSPQEVSNQ